MIRQSEATLPPPDRCVPRGRGVALCPFLISNILNSEVLERGECPRTHTDGRIHLPVSNPVCHLSAQHIVEHAKAAETHLRTNKLPCHYQLKFKVIFRFYALGISSICKSNQNNWIGQIVNKYL